MEFNTTLIIFSSVAVLIGIGFGILIQRKKSSTQLDEANIEAKEILNQSRREADRIKTEKMLQAKERFIELKSEHEKVIFQREKKISDIENRLRNRENKLNNDINRNNKISHSLQQKNLSLQKRLEKLDSKQKEVDATHKIQIDKLEAISGLSADDA